MKTKVVKIGLKRDVRHAPYNVSQCAVELTGHMEDDGDLAATYKELHSDAIIIVEEMVLEEKRNYQMNVKRAVKV